MAAMLCNVARIDSSTNDNSASYIQSWLRALKDDKTLVIQAASQAQKAVDYIMGTTFED
jgi:antirestriction protein ArdC